MNSKLVSLVPAGLGFLAVALGAFGAHGLHGTLEANGALETWETAVFYHFIHAVMMFVLAERSKVLKSAWTSFLLGILLFSGSLYVYSLTQIKLFAMITPLGGVAFLIGWWLLMVAQWNRANLK